MASLIDGVRDPHLRHTLSFGVAMHHAGLHENDRTLVERLFGEGIVQVLVSTATLAWGINLPAHLVVIKGTEYFDGKTHRYVDFPVTDVLQMMGKWRASVVLRLHQRRTAWQVAPVARSTTPAGAR